MAWRNKGKRGQILIVEDDWDILEVLQLMLEDEGHDVVSAKHGREALAVAATRPFDLVLMDISMPDMSGIDVAKALRAGDKTRDIRIAVHTGLDESWVRERFADYDLFLTKAADTDILVGKVAELLATTRGGRPVNDAPDADGPITFSLEDAVRAKRALRGASGAVGEEMPMAEFLRCIEIDASQLRRQGIATDDIAAMIGQALGRPFPVAMLEPANTP